MSSEKRVCRLWECEYTEFFLIGITTWTYNIWIVLTHFNQLNYTFWWYIVPFCVAMGLELIIHWSIFHVHQVMCLSHDDNHLFWIYDSSGGPNLRYRNEHINFVSQMVWRRTRIVRNRILMLIFFFIFSVKSILLTIFFLFFLLRSKGQMQLSTKTMQKL